MAVAAAMLRLLLILLLLATTAQAREVWSGNGFTAITYGTEEGDPTTTVINMVVKMPADSYILLDGPGALELYFPCKGWVEDVGILAVHGCDQLAADTRAQSVVYTEQDICPREGGVLMMVMVPHMFIKEDCRPTELRWLSRGYCYAENHSDSVASHHVDDDR